MTSLPKLAERCDSTVTTQLSTTKLSTPQPSTRSKIEFSGVKLNSLNRTVFFEEEYVITTGLEFNLLAILMDNAGSVVSRDKIAQEIFQRDLCQCDKSINSHITNLRKKLFAASSLLVIKTVKGQGYIFLVI